MDSKLSLEKITRILQTVEKIKHSAASSLRDDSKMTVRPENLSILRDALDIIAEHYPDLQGGHFSKALEKSRHYGSAYKNIKQHFRHMRGKKADIHSIMKTLNVISPVLDSRQKVYIEKIIKVFEILNS